MVPPAIPLIPPHLCIIEQVPYQCDVAQNGWTCLKTIYFKVEGVEGIKLTEAMKLRFSGLEGRDDPMFMNNRVGTSVSCRISVRGFYDSNFHYH